MELGMIGLGKMGKNLVQNMQEQGIKVTAFDLALTARNAAKAEGITVVSSLKSLVASLASPRLIWSMLPAGEPTNSTFKQLEALLVAGDIVIDGGNSYYQDSIKHAAQLATKKIHFLDVGTSGGMAGARKNGNFMIGGEAEIFQQVEPLFQKIAAPEGYLYTGPAGSGHYLKMIHNGIEYGMMQAIGEGFEILQKSPFDYDYQAVARVWEHGSVIRGWLMELAEQEFAQDPKLSHLKGIMHSSGEGAWTAEEAIKLHVPAPVIGNALMMRYRSEEKDTLNGKVVAALRNSFGGHPVDQK
ncbi:phosphogluconate dehydrogenase (NAD(+)-dependent, decarboxylating) [Liquorilactobacillus vini]|uniref:Phosphogluconate dehydrogenase n=1 Tax=Liquorilactobacillus vini DSM 20605 TaxID=1133569 RepID=A0A0R2CAT2_9LACO|nr:decarboxylating 6-phosphogluconate dehydrogenase [Liquorilactobacillus vini]KRM88975.1 phosphogluconate dehydrogenase [Liquorilactobacillus vini DSM 20605]